MTDSKTWVTIKIPRKTREKAKDDERTYEEIMQDGLDAPPESTDTIENRDEILRKLDQIQSAQGNT